MPRKVKAEKPYRWINHTQGYSSEGFPTAAAAEKDLLSSIDSGDHGSDVYIVQVLRSYTVSIGTPVLTPIKE